MKSQVLLFLLSKLNLVVLGSSSHPLGVMVLSLGEVLGFWLGVMVGLGLTVGGGEHTSDS